MCLVEQPPKSQAPLFVRCPYHSFLQAAPCSGLSHPAIISHDERKTHAHINISIFNMFEVSFLIHTSMWRLPNCSKHKNENNNCWVYLQCLMKEQVVTNQDSSMPRYVNPSWQGNTTINTIITTASKHPHQLPFENIITFVSSSRTN